MIAIACGSCGRPLPTWNLNIGDVLCASCGATSTIRLFPALLASSGPARPEIAGEGEATCFDHPQKRASAACDQCGRFVCDLCAVELQGKTWCPSCIAGGHVTERDLPSSRTLYDSVALMIAGFAWIIYPFMFVAAPAVVFMTIRYGGRPLALTRRNRWRFVAAIVVSLVEFVLWFAMVAAVVIGVRARKT